MQARPVKLRARAFTLLESLLVLAITSFLIVCFSGTMGNVVSVVRGELFLAQFEQDYKSVQYQAAASAHTENLSLSDGHLTFLNETLALPKEVSAANFTVTFDTHGNNSSLQKLQFYLPAAHQTVIYQLEMGNGKFKKTVS
jgi:competence protein ComGD